MSTNKKTAKESNQDKEKKNKAVYPDKNADTSNPAAGSMSEGNQVNGRGRERTSTTHTKSFASGTDSDGQAD